MKRYQSFTRTLAIGSNGLDNGGSLDVDNSYKTITGVSIKVISKGGLDEFDIGLQDNDKTYLNTSDSELAMADVSVPPNHKFLNVDIPLSSGQGLKLPINTPAITTAELKVKVTFRLER